MTVRGAERVDPRLTLDDVAGALKVSRRTVERLVADGELAVEQDGRDGRRVRVQAAELEAFIDERRS